MFCMSEKGSHILTYTNIYINPGVPMAEIYDPRPVFDIAPLPTNPLRHIINTITELLLLLE